MYYTTFQGVDSGNERVRDPVLRIAPVILAAAIAAIGWVYKPAQMVNHPTSTGQNSFSQSSQPAATSNQNTAGSTSTTKPGTGVTSGSTSAGQPGGSPAVGGRGGGGVPFFNTGGSPTK